MWSRDSRGMVLKYCTTLSPCLAKTKWFSTKINAVLMFLSSVPAESTIQGKFRVSMLRYCLLPWWRHQMETYSSLLALWAGNSPVTGEFPPQKPVTRRFDVFFDLCLNKRLSRHSWRRWFETQSYSLWRYCNAMLWKINMFFLPGVFFY